MLFEMMRGEVLKDGWQDEDVKESLDLCLACKGCKNECPVGVDMAAYKAEFFSHYYKGKIRPLKAYAFGYISRWCQVAERFPHAANFMMQNPFLGSLLKKIMGIANERELPAFASPNFRQRFLKRPPETEEKPQVLLWPDTFNNYFYPETLRAATAVLEKAGYQVNIPRKPLCCGRPLYDFGMLKQAKQMLKDIIETLEPYARRRIPVVALEPSCLAVFRDELKQLFPDNEAALLVGQQFFSLAEFLETKAKHLQLSRLSQKAVIHGHCHQKALWGMDEEEILLSKLGLDFNILDSGCCGMAGAFGFEKEHYGISKKIGALVLTPAVEKAKADTLIISNGFSCREQIRHLTGRQALHLAQVIQMAIN
jgi:Fe-S oxidoreductase